ncbi:DUF397 domain-containing protein [Sphaerisporangium perillae]|uniref:DUF397 domain-containing protein n=1 Tax=Sphaerisporangium perillae TaxID=2935860 RepID=UPI00200BB696|nr:DUF397 domain-containing protein [Sphaerisporangium perillae]
MNEPPAGLRELAWRKSKRSEGGNGCVELAVTDVTLAAPSHKTNADQRYLVRDSKNPDGPVLAFTPGEWEAFIAGVKDGRFEPENR